MHLLRLVRVVCVGRRKRQVAYRLGKHSLEVLPAQRPAGLPPGRAREARVAGSAAAGLLGGMQACFDMPRVDRVGVSKKCFC